MFDTERYRNEETPLAITAYTGADIDDYRQRFGKEEGERRFFAEQTASVRPIARPRVVAVLQACFMQIRDSLPF